MSGRDAYRAAGYTKCNDRAADSNASRLLKDAEVSARIAELKTKAADATVMDLREVLQELSKLGRSDIRNCVVGGDNTADVVASIRELPPEHSAAISELIIDTYVEGGGEEAREVKRLRLKLHDKRGALSELRRHHEPDKHEHSGPKGGPIETKETSEGMSELELGRRILFALELGARAAAKAPAATPAKPRKAKKPKPAEAPAPAKE